eukprot:evm.model.NODE_4862_length_23170_cov_39.113380.10
MADEPTLVVLGESGGGKLKYNLAEYLTFQKAVVKKCKELDKAVKGKNDETSTGGTLTADEIGRALWCVSKAAALGLLSDDKIEDGKVTKKRSVAKVEDTEQQQQQQQKKKKKKEKKEEEEEEEK